MYLTFDAKNVKPMIYNDSNKTLRTQLVNIALEWQRVFGVAPSITSAISEYDAAILIGCSEKEYSTQMQKRTAVSKGYDFIFREKRYQVKANRPSGKRGSKVTLVGKPKNYEWDCLVWILYDTEYQVQEAWLWNLEQYKIKFHEKKRISPADMREGEQLV